MNIIAVDDEKFALLDLEQAIQQACLEALVPEAKLACFGEAKEALAYAKETQIQVAFLDIEMGGMNGLELAKKIKEINRKTNIVFATGCKGYAFDAFSLHANGYLLKPVSVQAVIDTLKLLKQPDAPSGNKIRIQCFGNFEVFFDNKPLYFPRSKAKELFAYLVHKRGTGSNTRELAAILYEGKEDSLSLQNQVQTLISTMMKVLSEANVKDIIIKCHNNIAVDPSKIDCDYFRFLQGDTQAVNAYMGEYMANYSWSEFTLGYLDKKFFQS